MEVVEAENISVADKTAFSEKELKLIDAICSR